MFRYGKKYCRRELKKILKILTAIGDNNLNNKLKKEKEIEVIEKDVFYKEGILEILEKNKEIDIIILYEKLSGEINIFNLIKKIKEKNNKIEIFFILENKDEEKEKKLKYENINNIYYINEINLDEFIYKIKNKKINNKENLEKEIELLKKIINKKDEEILKYKNEKIIINNNIKKEEEKIIIVTGIIKSGKSLIINNLNNFIKEKEKIKLKEIKLEDVNMKKVKFLIIIIETEIEKIKTNKKIMEKLITNYKIEKKRIAIIFNKINKYSINKKILKNIFKEFKILGFIKLNNYPDYLINKKNNYKKENKIIKKEYEKIIKKLIKN